MESFACCSRAKKDITCMSQDITREVERKDATEGRRFIMSRLNNFCIIYSDTKQKSFHHLFGHPVIQSILYADKEFLIIDTFSLAMTYCYFLRCNLRQQQYTPINFLAALYLVLDVDEDSNHGRSIILKVLSSKSQVSPGIIRDFNRIKLDIWKEMGYRAIVSNSACKWVIERMPDHPVWRRRRDGCSYPTEKINHETKHRLSVCMKLYHSEE